jgi:macrolide-specific efflux system membrane fusion protein
MLTRFLPTVLLATACGAVDQSPAGPSPTEATNTKVVEQVVEEPTFVGVVTSKRSEIIPMAFTAPIKTLEVRPGDKVTAGDLIAVLDDADLRSTIEKLRAQENSASSQAGAYGASAAAARTKLGKLERAYKAGAISRLELASVGAELKSNRAQAGAAAAQGGVPRAERTILERQLANAQIKAPLSGTVMMVKAKEGEVAQQGTPIARIFDPSDLIVRFAVPKHLRTRIRKGTRVELQIEGVARTIWASVESFADEEAPINLTIVVADLDDKKLGPDEVQLASIARVRLPPAKAK